MYNYDSKSVLVTGASSGIGRAVALHLAQKGFTVLASVRKHADADRLNAYKFSGLLPVSPLDLTDSAQITNITSQIKEMVNSGKIPPLYSIINIAGGGQIAPIELMNINAYRQELEKRLVGPVVLLQELLPLLRITHGRIIWIATPGLLPVPYVADIHASDFAVNYLARTLNIELQPDGIRNILVRCGGIATTSPEKTEQQLTEMINSSTNEITKIYRNRLQQLQKSFIKFDKKRTNPQIVALTIEEALTAKHPRTRYQVGYLSGAAAFLEKMPQSLVDAIMKRQYR